MPWLLGQGLSGVLVGVGGDDLAEVDAVEISAGVSLLAHDLSRDRRGCATRRPIRSLVLFGKVH